MDDRRDSANGRGLSLYTIFHGEVASVQQYGVFIRIPSNKKQGLVHKTQMSNTKVEKPEDVCEVGDKVWCKVISVDADGGKIGLSMKVVNQTTGKDLDPNHVQTSLDEQRRKTGHRRELNKIELGAVFDTDCRKCGGKGHLAQDCFYTPGGQSYDLVPEEDFTFSKQRVPEPDTSARSHKHKKKEKKTKKKKKHKDSSDSDSEAEVEKHRHKKRKKHRHETSTESDSEEEHKKKHKKHKRRSSHHHSDTDSDQPKHKKKKHDKKRKKKHSHEDS